jgi:hypothetical protein
VTATIVRGTKPAAVGTFLLLAGGCGWEGKLLRAGDDLAPSGLETEGNRRSDRPGMIMTTSTALGMPAMPPREDRTAAEGISFTSGHHFCLGEGAELAAVAEAAAAPLSVIVQVTKRCDFGCVFWSETLQLRDPSLAELEAMRGNLAGVQRGVPVRRRAAAAPRPDRHRGHVRCLYRRAADQRHPRAGHGAEAGGQDRVRQHRLRRAARHLPPGPRRL